MVSEVPSSKKGPIKYNKVVANIPEGLLKEFDVVCEGRYYSRAEGIKQAMREFIVNSMPEDYVPPSIDKRQTKQGVEGIIDLFSGLAADPRIQQLQQTNSNTQLTSQKTKKK